MIHTFDNMTLFSYMQFYRNYIEVIYLGFLYIVRHTQIHKSVQRQKKQIRFSTLELFGILLLQFNNSNTSQCSSVIQLKQLQNSIKLKYLLTFHSYSSVEKKKIRYLRLTICFKDRYTYLRLDSAQHQFFFLLHIYKYIFLFLIYIYLQHISFFIIYIFI